MLLTVAITVSCFAVLAVASDEETEGGDTPEYSPIVLHNRDYADGWGVFNGTGVEKSHAKNHRFFIDKETTSDYSYNYFARFEVVDTMALGEAVSNTDGFMQVSFESANYPHQQHAIVEFDIKIDDICNIGNVLYTRTQGGSSGGGVVTQILAIENDRLKVLPSTYKDQEGIEFTDEWMHVVVDFDYTNPQYDPNTHVEVYVTIDGGEPYYCGVNTGSGNSGIDIFRFGLPPAKNAADSAERAGQSWCLDNLQAYCYVDERMSQEDIAAHGYGTLVDENQTKTVSVDGAAAEKTTWEYLAESLAMKIGVNYALLNNEQVNIWEHINGGSEGVTDYGAPVMKDGLVLVPFDIVLDYIGTGYFIHEDGKSYDISTGTGATYLTMGRNLATVNGNVVELTMAPGYYTDPVTGEKYSVVAMDDIERLLPGYFVTYDEMGLIIISVIDDILQREYNLTDMLSLMNMFVYNFIDEEEVYSLAKENTNNFTHPYLMGGQEVYDRIIAIYDGTDTTDYGVDLKTGITAQVDRAYHFLYHFSAPSREPVLDEQGNQLADEKGYPLYYNEDGTKSAFSKESDIYTGLNPYHEELETLKFPHVATNGYDPAGGRQAESGSVTGWAYDIAFGYIITGDIRLAQLTYDMLVAVGEWAHWCPGHFLNCADASQKYSMALDWIYNGIEALEEGEYDEEAVAPDGNLPSKYYEVGYLERLLYKNGLRMGYLVSNKQYHGHYRPQGDVCYYTTMVNNWNAVCTCGMWLTALVLMGSDEVGQLGEGEGEAPYSETAAWLVSNNLETLALYGMGQYAPDGSYVESPGYWGYGTNSMYLGLMSIWRCLGDDFGYMDAAGMDKTCYFACHVESSEYRTFSYHDGGVGTMDTSSFFFVAEAMNDPVLAEIRKIHLNNGKGFSIRDYLYFPYENINTDVEVELPLDYFMEGIDAFVTRSSWEKGALYAGVIAGMNNASHGQVDSGSFIYYNGGKIWLQDIGSDNYNIYGYFNGQNGAPANTRYRYYRMNAEGHNVVALTSQPDALPFGQSLTGGGEITDWFTNEFGSYAIIDNTGAYAGYATSAKRGMLLTNDRKTVVIQDEVMLSGVQTLYWLAHFDITNINYEISPNGRTMYLYWTVNNKVLQTLRLTIVSRNAYEKFTVTTAGETEEDRLLKGNMGTVDYAFSKANGALDSEKTRQFIRRIAVKAHTNTMQMAVCIELITSKNDPVGYTRFVNMSDWVPTEGIVADDTKPDNVRSVPDLNTIKQNVRSIRSTIENGRHLTYNIDTFYLDLADIYYTQSYFYADELASYRKELDEYEAAKAIYDEFKDKINAMAAQSKSLSYRLIGI